MSAALEQIQSLAGQLSLEEKKRAIEIMQALIDAEKPISELPLGAPGSVLLRFSLPEEDVDAMERTIQDFETVYPDEY